MVEIERRRDAGAVRRLLLALPDWFGDPEAVEGYAADAAAPQFDPWVAVEGEQVVGIALVRSHFPETSELHLITVDPAWRGRGIGRLLVEAVVTDLRTRRTRCLTVHTVGPSFRDAAYAESRAFYRRMGFIPLEEHVGLDGGGPPSCPSVSSTPETQWSRARCRRGSTSAGRAPSSRPRACQGPAEGCAACSSASPAC